MKWDDLFNQGSVIDLSTSLWRATTKIRPEDLGIEDSSEVKKALALGKHKLMPTRAFKPIMAAARAARAIVDSYSINFGFIRGARYVPNENLPRLMEELRNQRDMFDAAADEFVANYEALKDDMIPVIEQALRDASRKPEAVETAMKRLLAEYPDPSTIRAEFSLTWSVYTVQSPKTKGVAAGLEQESENVKGIVSNMVEQMRGDMIAKLGDLLKIIDRGGKLSDRTINSASETLDRLESLNVFGDEELSREIGKVRSWINGAIEGRLNENAAMGIADIRENLEKGLEEAVAAAEANLTGVGRRRFANGEDSQEPAQEPEGAPA